MGQNKNLISIEEILKNSSIIILEKFKGDISNWDIFYIKYKKIVISVSNRGRSNLHMQISYEAVISVISTLVWISRKSESDPGDKIWQPTGHDIKDCGRSNSTNFLSDKINKNRINSTIIDNFCALEIS